MIDGKEDISVALGLEKGREDVGWRKMEVELGMMIHGKEGTSVASGFEKGRNNLGWIRMEEEGT